MASHRVEWLTDLVRLEIVLWERVEARLQADHGLSLPFFETLLFLSRDPAGSRRVGDLAGALGITVGGMSKLTDRVQAAGLILRTPDPDDRRASRATLTERGRQTLAAATQTYDAAVAALLDPTLSAREQDAMHAFVSRLLNTTTEGTDDD